MLERFLGRLKKDTVLPQDRTRTANLTLEIRQCLEYFEKQIPNNELGTLKIRLVHGKGITVGKLKEATGGYFWEIDGIFKKAGKDAVSPHEYEEVIQKIHHITIPYSEHVRQLKEKKALIKH